MRKLSVFLLFLFLPSTIFAAEFVQQPLFLSKSPVTEGQKVRVYAIISNNETEPFIGNVLMSADGSNIGSKKATLDVGATVTVSVQWIPVAGDHLISAQLVADDGSIVQQVSQNFSILAIPVPATPVPPPTSPSTDTTNQSTDGYMPSTPITKAIEYVSPTTAKDTEHVFRVIDTARVSITKALDTQAQLAHAALDKSTEKTRGVEEKSSESNTKNHSKEVAQPSNPEALATFLHILWTCYLYVLMTLLFLIDNPFIFYPLLVIIFFYIIFRIYKQIASRK